MSRPPSANNSDVTQYEEIDHFDRPAVTSDGRDLNSGNILNKMKYRPLPPPPRPPRERKQRKPFETSDDKYDRDGGGERLFPTTLEDISRISSQDMEDVEEVEAATQTDPLPDDFCCEEFEITDDMKVIEPSFGRRSKTLEDILKEEQQAELDRAKQIADEECLSKGIQKFRDANQRSYSERSRGSTADRPKTPSSRPITPSAVVIERKIVLPTLETDATLIVRPVPDNLPVPRIDSLEEDSDTRYMEDTVDTEDERIVKEALRRYRLLDEERHQREASPPPAPTTATIESRYRYEIEDNEFEPELLRRNENVPPVIPPRPENQVEDPPIELLLDEDIPIPPPRRKSSASESVISVGQSVAVTEMDTIREQQINPVPDPPIELLQGGRLHITELEVDNLSVGALQAGRILVSDLQAISLNSQDLECKSGNLVVKGIELPPGFIQDLVDRVVNSEREVIRAEQILLQQQQQLLQEQIQHRQQEELSQATQLLQQQQTSERNSNKTNETTSPADEPVIHTINRDEQQQAPARPPPPPPQSLYPSDYAPYSIPPPSFYQLRNYPDESDPRLQLQQPHSPSATRRRRHHRRRDDSTSEEDYQREQRRSRHGTRSPEPTIADLSGQLLRACSSAIGQAGAHIMNLVRTRNKDENGNRPDINIGLIMCIVIVAVLMMLGMGSGNNRPVHHHHWDYFNPPENDGRK